jgi:DNA polymerase elongation subunit (family B)
LEYEKVYWPLLLVGRKMYAAMKLENGSTSFSASGLQCCRTDNFPLLASTQKQALEDLVVRQDVPKALRTVSEAMRYVRACPESQIDVARLIKSQQLTKDPCEYAGNALAHVAVAERTPGAQKGDRIEYLVQSGRGALANKALAPHEWSAERHAVDRNYYATAIDAACRKLLMAAATKEEAERALQTCRGTTVITKSSPLLRAFGIKREMITTTHVAQPKRRRKQVQAVLR